MPKKNSEDALIIPVLKYSTSYPYFGALRFRDLYNAQSNLHRYQFHDVPMGSHPVYIGKIDGNVICGALWRLMGYNPGRFGTDNPFMNNGRNNIFHFVRTYDSASGALAQVRAKLRDFLFANAHDNGQWNDVIQTNGCGFVNTILDDGHTGPMYKRLCMLRDAVQIITKQNVSDFRDKRGPYRSQIISAVRARHPNLFPDIVRPVKQSTPGREPEYDSSMDRIDDMNDSLQITLDNREYISPEFYEQALADRDSLISNIIDNYQR